MLIPTSAIVTLDNGAVAHFLDTGLDFSVVSALMTPSVVTSGAHDEAMPTVVGGYKERCQGCTTNFLV